MIVTAGIKRIYGRSHLAAELRERGLSLALDFVFNHTIIRAFIAMARIAAPATLFKSEAIVHPDEVIKFVHLEECQLSYDPLLMALLWEALATREVRLLAHAMRDRKRLPYGCTWVNCPRCHDDIGWTFDDERPLKT